MASGTVTWDQVNDKGNYLLQESRVGPGGPWVTVYNGTKNSYPVSWITPLWYRVRWVAATSNDQQIPEASGWSEIAQYTPPGLFIKNQSLKNGRVEWSSIPRANLYELQTAPKKDGAWKLIYRGPHVGHGLRAVSGAWYRIRALQKERGEIVCASNWSRPEISPPSARGFLRANGTTIRDHEGRGEEILLQGVNLGSLFLIEPWLLGIDTADPSIEDEWNVRNVLNYRFGDPGRQQILDAFYKTYIQSDDIDYLHSLGINAVRLPINYRLLQKEDGSWIKNASGQIDFSQIDRIVNDCADRGIYVLLDLHGAPGSQNTKIHSGRKDFDKLFEKSPEGEIFRKRTLELWRAIALHYKNNTAICGYDLLNEPGEPKDISAKKVLWEFYDRIYKAIRAVDENHIIMIEGSWGWDTLPKPSDMGWENVVYQFHYYHVLDNKDLQAQKDFIDQKIREGRHRQAEYQVPVMAGEFTCLGHLSAWEHYLKNFSREKWSWTMWTYKSCDPSLEWGLWNCSKPKSDIPRLGTDSFKILLDKFSTYSTLDHYSLNKALAKLIKNYAVPATDKPFIKDIFPGTVQPGEDFWIKGINFENAQEGGKVMLGGVSLPVIAWSNNAIHLVVPKNETRHFGMVSVQLDKIKSNECVLHVIQTTEASR